MSEDEEGRTVFVPGSGRSAPPSAVPASPLPPAPAPEPAGPVTRLRIAGGRLQPGDMLNHIFEVRRFIAAGGMGEVFEGINVTSGERVAIKVMLPALAADPNIQAMFRKEARTLTRLNSPALVQYRVLAQEPQLGVFYIVTEFIDGKNLCDLLGTLKVDTAELVSLTRRLATGLHAAHALGAIHRDISPDNVLLEEGKLDQAKIIDFGIAKDTDPGSKTIVGDGFAGKLGYVAPEQLGDFDRQIGPWTDVYSLGLVILAVAIGRNPDIGGSFVDAIEKRRKGPDLSEAPAGIQPILARMLVADPAQRIRSMDELLDLLRDQGTGKPVAPPAAAPKAKAKAAAKADRPPAAPAGEKAKGGSGKIIAGAVAGGVALLGVAGFIAFGGGSDAPAPSVAPVAATAAAPVDQARAAIEKALPGIPCTWLDLSDAQGGPGGVTARLAGVAGRPAEAQAAVARATQAAGVSLAAADFSDVAPISSSECQSVDAFRAIRATGAPHISVPQRKFEMSRLPADSAKAGQIGARVIVSLDTGTTGDFALYGIEPSGEVSSVIPNRAAMQALLVPGSPVADLGGGRYRLQVDADHDGWSGFVLLTGRGGFADDLVVSKPGARPAGWADRFAAAARANGWRSEMVWFKMIDEVPN